MLHLYVIHIKKVLNKSLSLSLLKFILIKRGRSYFLMKIQYCHSYHSLLKVKQNSLFDLDVIGAYKDMKISWHYAYYKYRTQIFQTACNIFRLMLNTSQEKWHDTVYYLTNTNLNYGMWNYFLWNIWLKIR